MLMVDNMQYVACCLVIKVLAFYARAAMKGIIVHWFLMVQAYVQ